MTDSQKTASVLRRLRRDLSGSGPVRRRLLWGGAALVVIFVLTRCVGDSAPADQRHGSAERAIPVVAARAVRGDLPVIIDALGTVAAANNVLVRSRVDGQLMRLHFTEGQIVKAGDLLAEIDPRAFAVQLQQAQGQLARDEALLKNARADLNRYEGLWQQDSISRQELDTQRALVAQYEGAVLTDRGDIASAQLQLSYAQIRAPISGRAGLRQVDPGNMVHASDSSGIVRITQEQPISVLFTIPEVQLQSVRKQLENSSRNLAVVALDRQRSEPIATGKLLTLDNQIDTTTGTIRLKAEFENKKGELFPNQFVNVQLHVDTLKDVVLIPANAVQRGSQGIYVYVVNTDKKSGESTVKLQLVQLGLSSGERVIVSEGLTADAAVVIDGVDRLRDGAKVELIDRAASS